MAVSAFRNEMDCWDKMSTLILYKLIEGFCMTIDLIKKLAISAFRNEMDCWDQISTLILSLLKIVPIWITILQCMYTCYTLLKQYKILCSYRYITASSSTQPMYAAGHDIQIHIGHLWHHSSLCTIPHSMCTEKQIELLPNNKTYSKQTRYIVLMFYFFKMERRSKRGVGEKKKWFMGSIHLLWQKINELPFIRPSPLSLSLSPIVLFTFSKFTIKALKHFKNEYITPSFQFLLPRSI